MAKTGLLASSCSPLPYRESTFSESTKEECFICHYLGMVGKSPAWECLRYQCFYLCLQAIDVNPSFFPSNVIKWSSNKEKICQPITVHIKWAELRSKIRSNLCSRKRQTALSLEFSIYSFVELVSFAAVRQFLEQNITYLLICGSFPYYLFYYSHPLGQILQPV